MSQETYLNRLWNALLGRACAPITAPPAKIAPAASAAPMVTPSVSAPTAELEARLSARETELRQRDDQIGAMKREYAALEAARAEAAALGGTEQLEKLFRKVCGPLSNLATLVAAVRHGKEVAPADMADLVDDLGKQLTAAGLEAIGQAGQAAEFDVALHQRMSGSTVHPGTPVVVQIPGYRLGERILQKAMVTAK